MLDIRVKEMLPGDILVGSGCLVITRPYSGVRTPKGKVEFTGRYPGSTNKRMEWNAQTRVSVKRS